MLAEHPYKSMGQWPWMAWRSNCVNGWDPVTQRQI